MSVRGIVAVSLCILLSGHAMAAPPSPSDAAVAPAALDLTSAIDSGWQEAVISVSNAQPLLRFFRDIAGWQVGPSRPMPLPTRQFYLGNGLAGSALQSLPAASAREWLVTDKAGKPGFIRVVELGSSTARPLRAGAMPWDTGGILSLMTRSNATTRVFDAALAAGWSAVNEPVEFTMTDTGVKLSNVILRGPDGVHISIYERLQPRMPDEPDLQRLRRPFNSMQSVRDIGAARRFYTEVLGFEILNSGDFVNAVRLPNNFAVPANLVVAAPLPFAIMGPRKTGPTQVEVVQLRGVEGRDLAARADPDKNLGIIALRFPVSDLQAVQQRILAAHWPLARSPTELDIVPYGRVTLLAVKSPDGAWLEFFTAKSP